MLTSLSLRDYVLAEKIDAEFGPGLNVITGETGAGKSVIMGALSLLSGARGGADQVRTGCAKALLQAAFSVRGRRAAYEEALALGFPVESEELILRREIHADGRSACFINDVRCTLSALESLSSALLQMHGQHEHHRLFRTESHAAFLDAFAGHDAMLAAYREARAARDKARMALEELLEREKALCEKRDFLEFQKKELTAARLETGREEKLLNAVRALENSGRLASLYAELETVAEGELPGGISRLKKVLSELSRIDSRFAALLPLAEEAGVRLTEAAGRALSLRAAPEGREEDLDRLNTELAAISRLRRKFKRDESGLIALLAQTQSDLDLLENMDGRKAEREQGLARLEGGLKKAARALSAGREKKAPEFDAAVNAFLGSLNMPAAGFRTRLTPLSAFSPSGAEEVEFTAALNPGEPARPLSRIASGGEISRVMLALRSVMAEKDRVPVLVFDEVDAGIGGETAVKAGLLLKKLSRFHQVFCITHLHQIAKEADRHYCVGKEVRQGRTLIRVRELSAEEKISELARMLGDARSREGLTHARSLLRNAS